MHSCECMSTSVTLCVMLCGPLTIMIKKKSSFLFGMGGLLWELFTPQALYSHLLLRVFVWNQWLLHKEAWSIHVKGLAVDARSPFTAWVSHYQPLELSLLLTREGTGREGSKPSQPSRPFFLLVGAWKTLPCCNVLNQPRLNIFFWSGGSTSSVLLHYLATQQSPLCGPPWCSLLFEQGESRSHGDAHQLEV